MISTRMQILLFLKIFILIIDSSNENFIFDFTNSEKN